MNEYVIEPLNLSTLVTPDQAWNYKIIPKEKKENVLHFYIDENVQCSEVEQELEILFDKQIVLTKVEGSLINAALTKFYRKASVEINTSKEKITKDDDFLVKIIREAKSLKSSDIHIEIYENICRVRIRIDGALIERYELSKAEYPSVINKIKIQSNLDIAEKRLPQDGRILFKNESDRFDIRVSILPTLHGEKVVLRILSNDATNIDINKLGFNNTELDDYLESIRRTQGIILISGPTGSGKTTTLYATLKILNKERTNILTIEDPIEYTLPGVNQVQLKESIGLTFSSALRTFLRQDPDIIMLGEIRDSETAQMAVRASLTGHLVLSTIHTNSALGTINRLIDMGIPSYLLASTLNATIAQRLIKTLCPHCKIEVETVNTPKTNFQEHASLKKHFIAVGCDHCYHTGYSGRKAIYEVVKIDNELSNLIRTDSINIEEVLKSRNIKTLAENAWELYRAGQTSLEEIYPILLENTR